MKLDNGSTLGEKVSAEKEEMKQDQQATNGQWNTRFHYLGYLFAVFGGILCGTMYLARYSISVVMLSMVNRTHLYLVEHPNVTQEMLEIHVDSQEDGEFNWSNEMQQAIIGSYMISYTLPQVFAGKLCIKHGPRLVAALSIMLCGVACLATPFFSYLGWEGAMAMRMLNGLGASGTITFVIVVIETWLPENRIQIGVSIMQIASNFLIFLSPLLSGLLSEVHWNWGFYFPGAACSIVAIIWYLLVRDSPAKCSFVSQMELDQINKQQMREAADKVVHNKEEQMMRERAAQLPWYFMFKIKSFYLFALVWCCHCITDDAPMILLPTYLAKAYQLSIKENGLYNFIISSGILVSVMWPTPVVIFLQNKLKLSLTSARRVIIVMYSTFCALSALYIALYHDQQVLMLVFNRLFNVTKLILVATLMSQYGKYGLSGHVYGTLNTIGMLTLALFCWASGKLLDLTGESYTCWSWIFASFAIFNTLVLLIYFGWLKSEPVRIRELEKEEAKASETKAPV